MASEVPSFSIEGGNTPPLRETTFTIHDGDDEEGLFDGNTLSPLSARFPPFNSLNNTNLDSPTRSSHSHLSPYSPSFASNDSASSNPTTNQPFAFTPQQYVVGRPPGAHTAGQKQTELGRRRGHKYARSSVSHQIILSPTPRLPLQLPTSLPIPTFKEFRASMTSKQKGRWILCLLQLGIAGYVQWTGAHGNTPMATTALSHLLFYDALSSVLGTAVSVGRNFEVWNRASLRHPFGLERSQVVAGLAMGIVLLFMGLDCVSHGLTHSLEEVGGHEAHHVHVHSHSHVGHEHEGEVSRLNLAALVAIVSTLISATSTSTSGGNDSAHPNAKTTSYLPTLLQNPTHALTLTLSTLLFLPPLLNISPSPPYDMTLAFLTALTMITLGSRLCYTIGRMLLMSFPSKHGEADIHAIVAELWEDDTVSEVREAKVWQVHYGLCMANFRISVRSRDAVGRVRDKVERLVKGGLEAGGGPRWEVSSMIDVVRE